MYIFAVIAAIAICVALGLSLAWNHHRLTRLRYHVISKCPNYSTFYAVKDHNTGTLVSKWFERDSASAQRLCNRLNNLPYLTGDSSNDRQQIETYLNKTSKEKQAVNQETFVKD